MPSERRKHIKAFHHLPQMSLVGDRDLMSPRLDESARGHAGLSLFSPGLFTPPQPFPVEVPSKWSAHSRHRLPPAPPSSPPSHSARQQRGPFPCPVSPSH